MRWILFLVALCLGDFQAGHSEPVDGGRATVELIAERRAVQPGELFFAAFDMQLDEGWHVYWRNPGDAGLPPSVETWEGNGGEMAGEFAWPLPHELPVVPGQIMDYGYDERLVLPFPVSVPDDASGLISLSGVLGYLICEEICIPEEVPFRLVLPVANTPRIDEDNGALIASWLERTAEPLDGAARITEESGVWTLSLASPALVDAGLDVRFFPYRDEIVHSAEQPAAFGQDGARLALTPFPGEPFPSALTGLVVTESASGARRGFAIEAEAGPVLPNTSGVVAGDFTGTSGVNLISIALLALAGGLILNLMPCVLPVLAIKTVGLVTAASGGETARLRQHGLLYTVGVVLSFLAIASLFVALRATGEFLSIGFQLQYPLGVSLLALLMFVLGLWLLGSFEIGGSVQGVGSDLAAQGGAAGAFFTGVLAALVGAPCIGPFLGVALGAVITEPAPIVLLVFGLVGLGLALPFLILSFLPGLQRFLPKPGAWMETFKQIFAFPLFLTSAWLLSVLGDQAGSGA
ncbi:MAG: protein-disulfide reductase DsbD domain-containing protein, partial [Pseudomonadota bacterium]